MVKVLFSLCIAVAVSVAPSARAQGVTPCSNTTVTDERVLCHEVAIEAPAAEVWALLTTSEGLRSWLAPVAAIELRVGGMWESSYNRDAQIGDPGNIRNRVIAFVPEQMLIVQVAQAPHLLGRQHDGLAGSIEHDEVVARALHLGEAQLHARDYLRPGRRAA